MQQLVQVNDSPVGRRIFAWRKAAGFSTTELGREAEVSSNYITELERGYGRERSGRPKRPAKEILVPIAKAVRKNPAVLLWEAGYIEKPQTLGTCVRLLRETLELSQSGLHDVSRVSQPYISQIENDVCTDLGVRVLRALAKGLRVEVEILIEAAGYSEDPRTKEQKVLPELLDLLTRMKEERQWALLDVLRGD